jgi:predicted peroxiredoxin
MGAAVKNVVIIVTAGKSDNGKHATMGFSCALSAQAMGHRVAIFLTSDGAVWGYRGSTHGIMVQGFPPLAELVSRFLEEGGRLILCSVCHRTCGTGGPEDIPVAEKLPQAEIGGFVTIIELATDGVAITF